MKKLQLWQQIVIAIVLGALVGIFSPSVVPYIKFMGEIFLRLLKMLIAPLVLTTLISGVVKMGDIQQLRTVGIRIVLFYIITSTIAAAIGMGFALISQPGKGVVDLLTSEVGQAQEYSFVENMIGWIPTNIFESLTNGDTLQIIVFALFSGVVLLILGDSAKTLVKVIEQGADLMLKMTELVMKISPFGIFALIADMMTKLSGSMLMQVLNMIITDWVACLVVIFILQPLLVKALAKISPFLFLKKIAPAMIVAASTTSSAATLPVSIDLSKNELGIPEKIYGFTLPLGNTCNMNGMAVALGVISVFASNLYGYDITAGALIQFVFMGLVLSIGAAGVKGAGIVMSTVLLQTLGMPLTLVPILAAIWPVIDICHTTANITGDLAGTIVVAHSVGELDREVLNS
ncbi:dicarboxylate/amino acid:cation symporter [Peptoniphilus sp. AGMB00490]|uniref:Dicarboxylate/amino acid:cation symporter n=2 Tax=Peptoniphilus TaxID=162289 RepID=A0ACD6AZG8_9FIRM|nr:MULTISPECIES: dicarboxylate/amino acid:cation symporter [Peptoniphilus]NMW84535.1 dicarboxylate/amino acid:cation symporter [Peptoniphilus faecalis]OLR64908.1 glutamate:protein symporter [Peptoniphilus porci]